MSAVGVLAGWEPPAQLGGAGSWALRSWVKLQPRFAVLALPLVGFVFLILVGVSGRGFAGLQLEVWSGNNGTKELLYKVPTQAWVCLPCCSSAPCSQSWESWFCQELLLCFALLSPGSVSFPL